jgi:hypothetical protein
MFLLLLSPNKINDSVAQLVEQLTLNQRVRSSILRGVTYKIVLHSMFIIGVGLFRF